jgi:hypothetical protein
VAACSTPCCAASDAADRAQRASHVRRRHAADRRTTSATSWENGRDGRLNTLDHWNHYYEAAAQLAEWRDQGKLKFREHVLEGLDRAPEALVRLFAGDHLGKLVVRVSE